MADASIDAVLIQIDSTGQLALGVVLALIMFGVALDLRLGDFIEVFRRPLAPLSGLAAQLLVLPAVTWAITMLLQPQPSVALGMIVVAACPGGNLSNLMTHMAKGNTALSVSMTGMSSILAIVTTPLNILFWASLNPATAVLLRQVSIEPVSFLGSTVLLLGLPMAAGMLTVRYWPVLATRLRRPFQILSFLFLIVFIVGATVANGRSFTAFLSQVLPLVVLHNTIAVLIGWLAARLWRLNDFDTRAMTIEVSMHNSGLGLALILNHFDALGGAALIAAGWGIWHIVSGWGLAAWWQYRDRRRVAAS
ncbi:MAG: bile acid:sodium symporter family protein [Ferrovibrio sp.]|uniref:bile acid:sodium symporter family protein n=1 Tax=Ferrovibrio sp. TaxID=1917215 RepID=UPI0026172130|nr:bile acid:sodium symporter family protein [Ferrovibrio sp.]MCW0234118.1 bile acid:sodium symporter family protein [Ferrovibrio sp.]